MNRTCLLVLLTAATLGMARAETLIVRRAQLAEPVELRGANLSFVLPEAGFTQSLNGAWFSRHAGQEATFEGRPASDLGLIVRYSIRGEVEEGYSYGRSATSQRALTVAHRPALVAQISASTTLEAAMESQARFDAAMHEETALRQEAVLRSSVVPGLIFSSSVGHFETRNPAGQVRDQTYLTLSAEQKIPGLPVRITLSPNVAQETWQGSIGTNQLAGWNSSLALDAAAGTTFSLLSSRFQGTPGPGAPKNTNTAWAVQVERQLSATVAFRLLTSYEEQWNAAALANSAIFLGGEATFSLTDSINGGIQLRRRVVQLINAAMGIPETVLSFTLGGTF